MPHTEQQRLLSCGSTDQRRIQEGGGVVTEISEAHRPSVLFVGGGSSALKNERNILHRPTFGGTDHPLPSVPRV